MTRFSVCIPAHDRGENGPKWMRELLNSLKTQTLQDFDIVVPDQSKNDKILDTCKEYSENFEFTYIRYEGEVACENINIGLKECTGEIVKIIFSDDVFVSNKALEIISNYYKDNKTKWAFSGFCEMTEDGKKLYGENTPRWNQYTLEGCNNLSSPSVVSFRNDCKEYFDLNMRTSLDVEFYHRMRWNYGLPHFIEGTLVANRGHGGRVSSTGYDTLLQKPEGSWVVNSEEINYIRKKHKDFLDIGKYPDEI